MKKFYLVCLSFGIYSAVFSQSASVNATTATMPGDTLKQAAPAVITGSVIADEGTNEPSGFQKTSTNGKDIYIKQESQITIIYEPK